MAVKIITKPAAPAPAPAQAPERAPAPVGLESKGRHLRGSPWEAQAAFGYSGTDMSLICETKASEPWTVLLKDVTCPVCLHRMRDYCGYEISDKQAKIVGDGETRPPTKLRPVHAHKPGVVTQAMKSPRVTVVAKPKEGTVTGRVSSNSPNYKDF